MFGGRVRSFVRLGLVSLAGIVGAASGCLDRPVGPLGPETTSLIVDKISQDRVDKIDLLFMVDNSVSMADKQQILQAAVPDLVSRLVNPVCVDGAGDQFPDLTPADPNAECPDGYGREFEKIDNINIGVISSSLGGFGSTSGACANSAEAGDQKQDMAHLVGSLPRGVMALGGSAAANAMGHGFVEWRPNSDSGTFTTAFQNLVAATGEFGCGYEASLEAWYRFLVDPEPYLNLAEVSCVDGGTDKNCRAPELIDQTILDQRAAFLRPDSLVAVVMLSDENDCSVKASGQAWYVAQVGAMYPMWRAATICETDPNNACCYSCGQSPPANCAADPVCGDPAQTREPGDYYLDAQGRKSVEDQDNLRCFHQKQRFGVDFLYPIKRYSNALSQRELCMTRNDLSAADCGGGRIVDNPLYALPEGSTATLTRDSNLVFLAGIVGVPWQDIARDPTDANNLEFKTFSELETVWPVILGDGVTPGDALMVESIAARTGGDSPVVGAALVGPNGGALEHPVNGHEWSPSPPSDLQYACIFPLAEPRDCAALKAMDDPRHCDCDGTGAGADGQQSKPLCQDPQGDYGTTQYYAKAYPGIRELQVLKEYGAATTNSIVASICARNVDDPDRADYGYRPAIGAIIDRLKEQLQDRCLPRPLALDGAGNVPCSIVEARRKTNTTDACQACGSITARGDVNPQALPLLYQKMDQNGLCSGASCSSNYCLCEVLPARRSGGIAADAPPNLAAEADCQTNEVVADATDGWCYVDTTDPDNPVGSPALVAKCPATAKRKLRFVGDGRLAGGSTTFVACLGASLTEDPAVAPAPGGNTAADGG
jgi:hypothetical protein